MSAPHRTAPHNTRQKVRLSPPAAIYTKENIDFLAAYLVPERLWYVLPVEAFAPRTSLHFNPHGAARGMFEKFREAWCILASAASNLFHAIPQTCRNRELPIRCAVCPERCAADTIVHGR